jgi:DNA (cytosine-5)-methyltransferase 1
VAASFQSNFIHPWLDRNFTAREGARLQSFPDRYIFKGDRTAMSWEKRLSQYRQIGNAVPPLLAKSVAKAVLQTLKGNKT